VVEILSLVMNSGQGLNHKPDLGYDVEERQRPEQEEYRPAERQPTSPNLSFSRPPETPTSAEDNDSFRHARTLVYSGTATQVHSNLDPRRP